MLWGLFLPSANNIPIYDGKDDYCGYLSPAHVASRYGLLDEFPPTDVWLNQVTERWQRTPLMLASTHGHEDIVQLPLSRKDVDTNLQDNHGPTLLAASKNGDEEIVELLLSRHDVDINSQDMNGRTALIAA